MKSVFITATKKSIIVVSALIIVFLSGCNEDHNTIPPEKILEYYELNRQNSLNLFLPVMFNLDSLDEELFKIVHFSDAHVSSWSRHNNSNALVQYNLKEAVQFANDPVFRINAMVATGDHIGNHAPTTRSEAVVFLNKFTHTLYAKNHVPAFVSTGNHDINMMHSDIRLHSFSKTELYNLLTSKINYPVQSEGQENFYYADLENPMGGVIRIIALDVVDQDHPVYNAQHNAILSQKQIDWLCHTALKKDMTDLHSVIILLHHPLPPDDEEIRMAIRSEFLHNWNMLPEIIETFRTKQSITRKYKNKELETDSISVNVSFADTPGEFICYLGGHLHTYLDYEVRSSSIQSSLPKQIMIIANNMSPCDRSATTFPVIERSDTGLRNNTFNLYAIDTKNKIIHVTFFGATGFYYPHILKLHYL